MEFSSRVFSYDHLLSNKKRRLPVGDLLQVSELSVIRGGEIADHYQFCDEITYAVSGSARFYVDGEVTEVHGGQIHFVRKGPHHKIIAGSESNFRYICIGFEANETCENIASYIKMRSDTAVLVKDDDGSVKRLTELLVDEFCMKDDHSDIMINMYLSQILISLARICSGNVSYMDKQSTSLSNYAVYSALRYIDREYVYITSAKSVAKELAYSEYYLSHIFSEKVGISIKEYIMKKKLQAAAEMLRMTKLSVGEISDYLNFNTQHAFSQAFRRVYSVSPNEYRKR